MSQMRGAACILLGIGLLGGCGGPAGPLRYEPVQLAPELTLDRGAIVRGPRQARRLALVFTGGSFGEGTGHILDVLATQQVKASFFFTGDYLANPEHRALVRRMVREGHLVGPHSHAHLLYCDWSDRGRTLVTREQFRTDIDQNIRDLLALGVPSEQTRWFIPPYEWYNEQVAGWAAEMGLVLFNFTPGTRSNTDYMPDSHPRFVPSQQIMESIIRQADTAPDGLNGYLLLLHVGAGPERTDKMHPHLGPLIAALRQRGYSFARVDELLTH